MGRQASHAYSIWMWDVLLSPVFATEARYSARNDHHQTDRDSSDNEEQFQVDLAVLAGEPWVAVAGDVTGLQNTLPVPVAQLTLRGCATAYSAWESPTVGPSRQVEVAGHA